MLETLTVDHFAALRGQRFRIAPDGAPAFEAELVEVTKIPREPGGRAPYSLVFEAVPTRRCRSASTAWSTARRCELLHPRAGVDAEQHLVITGADRAKVQAVH